MYHITNYVHMYQLNRTIYWMLDDSHKSTISSFTRKR